MKFGYKTAHSMKLGIKQVLTINLRFEIKYPYSYSETARGNIYTVKQVNRNNISSSMSSVNTGCKQLIENEKKK